MMMVADRKRRAPSVAFAEPVRNGMLRGVDILVNAIAPTLGPHTRHVAFHEALGGDVELLDSGATIARRIVELDDRAADVGAMYLRQVLWKLHETVGDGTATAAVMFHAIFKGGVRYVAAGGNPQHLRQELERGLQSVLRDLETQVCPLGDDHAVAFVARSVTADPALASSFGDIFAMLGQYGRLEVRKGHRAQDEIAFQAGTYWDQGAVSPEMMLGPGSPRHYLQDAGVLITDLEIEEPHHLVPSVAAALEKGCQSLVIVANGFSEKTLGVLLSNRERSRLKLMAVKTPAMGSEQVYALEDLRQVLGGRVFHRAAGDSLREISAADLGRARRAWVDAHTFGVMGGAGDAGERLHFIEQLKCAYAHEAGEAARRKLQRRIGQLYGGTATLWVGGLTEPEMGHRKQLAERAEKAVRSAMTAGVLPGGGSALMTAQRALGPQLSDSENAERRAAGKLLYEALEAPLRTILTNAGYDASSVMAAIRLEARSGLGFDVERHALVDSNAAQLLDVAATTKAAVSAAVRGAALALTIDTVVHHREREIAYTP